jgi:hypothetical protein
MTVLKSFFFILIAQENQSTHSNFDTTLFQRHQYNKIHNNNKSTQIFLCEYLDVGKNYGTVVDLRTSTVNNNNNNGYISVFL